MSIVRHQDTPSSQLMGWVVSNLLDYFVLNAQILVDFEILRTLKSYSKNIYFILVLIFSVTQNFDKLNIDNNDIGRINQSPTIS